MKSDRPDVGFLELSTEFVQDSLHQQPLGLERLRPCGVGDPSKLAYLCGYPGDLIKQERQGRVVDVLFKAQVFANTLLMPEDWGVVRSGDDWHRPDPDLDIILPYDRSESMLTDGYASPDGLSIPRGMSGGGYWQGPSSAEVWAPDKYNLIAIQSRWPSNDRYLQGTQIIHWLKLVVEKLPELRHSVESTFASLG